MLTNAVTEVAAPATYASDAAAHRSLVARKKDEMICGPAIITKASGRIWRKLTRSRSGDRHQETCEGDPTPHGEGAQRPDPVARSHHPNLAGRALGRIIPSG